MAELAAELPGTPRRHTEFEALCADPNVYAVFVGTPNQLHVPVALSAVQHGKHVLCTKPLSASEVAARELVEAAAAAGVVGMMAMAMRFSGPVRFLGEQVRSGALGEVYYARARSVRRSGIPDWGAHFIGPGGGAFRDMAVHVLDAAWWMAGCPEPVSVTGIAGARFGPRGQGYWQYRPVTPEFAAAFAADDYGAGLIRFANGAAIQVESFWASHQPDEVQIELFGADGGARLNPMTLYHTVAGRPADTTLAPPEREGFDGIAEHFLDCVLDGVTCEAPLAHGLTVQRMLEGVLASAETGRDVPLAEL
jgi:predicted dehydrogenase